MKLGDGIILASGTVTMLGSGQGSGDNTSVATGIMDPDYYPVITLVPVGEYANINPWVGTDVQYVAGQGWYFSIIRSIGSTNNNYESMDIKWSVVALRPVEQLGAQPNTESEPQQNQSGGSFYFGGP